MAKNLATYLLWRRCSSSSAWGWWWRWPGAPPAWVVAAAVALHLGAAPWLYGLGNLVSVLNPRTASLTLQRSGNLSALSSLAGMGIISGVAVLFGLPVLLALKLDSGCGAAGRLGRARRRSGCWLYWRTLPRVSRLLSDRRELVIGSVAGEEG